MFLLLLLHLLLLLRLLYEVQHEGGAPFGAAYFASEATLFEPFRVPFFVVPGVPGVFFIRNDAGT